MIRKYGYFLAVSVLTFSSFQALAAETWRLEKGRQWKAVTDDADSRYVLEISKFKRLVDEGEAEQAEQAADTLKKEFAQIAGADFDSFVKAELLFARGSFSKALKAYDEFLDTYPASALYESAMEREYLIGQAFLGGEKHRVLKLFRIKGYAEGAGIMERLAERAGDAPLSQRAMVAVAQSFERRGKWHDAYDQWNDISARWPTGQLGQQALLNMAQTIHAAYQGPRYDSALLLSAKSYYEQYKLRYPQNAFEIGVDSRLEQIEEQLAYKQFMIGRYYDRTGSMQAAELYYEMILNKWPTSVAAKNIRRLKMEKQLEGAKK
ncbi:MAG: outer membrane protein assembly factor BamD [Planctomycetota bacterium]